MTHNAIGCLLGVGSALLVAGCGGTMAFQGQSALTIVGNPPAPAPPPPVEEPPAPPPRVEVRDDRIEIREKIQFEYAKANILAESHDLLNEITDVIQKNPHIKKISIEGHASSEGNPDFNRRLSDDRAKAVMAYLAEKGIDKGRLTAKGYGADKPIANNETEDGREKNRRVEFNIVEQDITQKKVEVDPATGKEKVVETKKLSGSAGGGDAKESGNKVKRPEKK
jgi:OOP family OmpA-OmpF porin